MEPVLTPLIAVAWGKVQLTSLIRRTTPMTQVWSVMVDSSSPNDIFLGIHHQDKSGKCPSRGEIWLWWRLSPCRVGFFLIKKSLSIFLNDNSSPLPEQEGSLLDLYGENLVGLLEVKPTARAGPVTTSAPGISHCHISHTQLLAIFLNLPYVFLPTDAPMCLLL